MAVLVPALALAGGAWWSWRNVQAAARSRVERTVGVLHEHALRSFETQNALLTTLQWNTRALSWPEIAASAEIADLAAHLARSTPGTSAIGMVDPDGRVVQITSSPFPPSPISFADRDYIQAQRGPSAGLFISAPLTGRISGRAVFNYSLPHLGPDGRPDGGAMWATFPIREFEAFYRSLAENPRDVIALLRREDGVILARHPPAPPGQRVPRGTAGMAAVEAAGGSPGRVGFAEDTSVVDGLWRLYAATPVRDLPVAVVYGLSPDGPRAEWLRQVSTMAAVAAVASLLLLWAAWYAARVAGRGTLALARERDALALVRDEAEQRGRAEAAMRESQRMGALGQVAAGVAHDFRNTVQAVTGGTLLARQALKRGDAAGADALLAMIADAARRGGALTERMVAAARRASRAPGQEAGEAALDPVAAIEATAALLERSLSPTHHLRLAIDREGLPARVRGEAAELEAALLNLVANARDAMPGGGEIVLSARADLAGPAEPGSVEAGAGVPPPAALRPGRYARIEVADTGIGMDAATLARAREAFFTTKRDGKGTGLGLATASAFAGEAGGALEVTSPGLGRGASVVLWLPEAEAAAGPGALAARPEAGRPEPA
ncbi:hypothetical protein EAH89_19170 [Roseomonas nepalensis]|uniref:histidine kinase n=1 Tax=Muricoccus nepalensis TaxID=1854500 RepID=A0A502FR40_9PROT|nr:hybrid sensor histidine kinase/response regulator [Roseomonas nepalensis]TPG51881.1 hypothetical protein EAH89_19170 [Roseomonas nepalensis]